MESSAQYIHNFKTICNKKWIWHDTGDTAADFYKLIFENSEKILMEIAIQTHCNVEGKGRALVSM